MEESRILVVLKYVQGKQGQTLFKGRGETQVHERHGRSLCFRVEKKKAKNGLSMEVAALA